MASVGKLAPVLGRYSGLIFLAKISGEKSARRLVLHSTRPDARALKSELEPALKAVGDAVTVEVRIHRPERLNRARSLQSLLAIFGPGEIAYDPTGVFGRMDAIAQSARQIRSALGGPARAFAVEPTRRTLFVVLNRSPLEGPALRRAAADALVHVAGAMKQATADEADRFNFAVRVGYDFPSEARLVPVDDASAPYHFGDRMKKAFGRAASAAGIAALFGVTGAAVASAADVGVIRPVAIPPAPPTRAVSGLNFDFAGVFGAIDLPNVDDKTFAAAVAKLAIPVGNDFGLQVEGGIGTSEYYGIGGHLFWRDPNSLLLGAVGSYESLLGTTMWRVGGEGEAYLGQFTIAARAGYQAGDVPDGFFGRLDLSFYATPDFVLRAGIETTPGISFGRAGLEWRPAFTALPGLSVYGDTQFDGGGFRSAMLGLKLHFGDKASTLMDRDRKEDPSLAILNLLPLADAHQAYLGKN